mgnify:CR=1 FL=1
MYIIYMNVELSVIVPCYKVEKYVARCLDSLLKQTINEIEIICVNDGSPDHTIDILKRYQEKYSDKVRVIDKCNEGVWKARLEGVTEAKGKYVGFIDADDYVKPNYAEIMLDTAINYAADITICGFERMDMETGIVFSREMCKKENAFSPKNNPAKLISINGAVWNKIFKADLIKNMKTIANPPTIWEDIVFQLLLYSKVKKVAYAGECLIYYMVHQNSAINTVKLEQIEEIYCALTEVRDIYAENATDMLSLFDTIAFLHLGISLNFRLSCDKTLDLKSIFQKNNAILNQKFPLWKKSKYLRFSYMVKNGFANWKLWIMKLIYQMHGLRLFLSVYRFMINKLKIDIKW